MIAFHQQRGMVESREVHPLESPSKTWSVIMLQTTRIHSMAAEKNVDVLTTCCGVAFQYLPNRQPTVWYHHELHTVDVFCGSVVGRRTIRPQTFHVPGIWVNFFGETQHHTGHTLCRRIKPGESHIWYVGASVCDFQTSEGVQKDSKQAHDT